MANYHLSRQRCPEKSLSDWPRSGFALNGVKWRAGVLRDSVMHRPALLGKMGNGRSSNLY